MPREMGVSGEQLQLRPLGIGEIFDRAVTLYVRNFVQFAIMASFVVVPLTIAQYFIILAQGDTFAQILQQAKNPSATPPIMPLAPVFFIVIGVAMLLSPFMYVAIASGVARLYRGQAPDWRAAYGVALRHTGGILLTLICQGFILIVAMFAVILILTILIGIAAVSFKASVLLGVLLTIVAIAGSIALFLGMLLCYLAMALSFEAIGIEEFSFGRAIGASFARVFNRAELGKALLVCLAFVAIEIALMIVSGTISALFAMIHQPVLQTVLDGVLSLATTGFLGVLIAVYYFDVRVRHEGLDMVAAVEGLATQPLP